MRSLLEQMSLRDAHQNMKAADRRLRAILDAEEPNTEGLRGLYAAAVRGETSRHQIEHRDLVAALANSGGFLNSPRTFDVENPLPSLSVARHVGVRAITVSKTGEIVQPVFDTRPAFEWLLTEGTPLTSQTPSLGAATGTPKMGGAVMTISHTLNRQSDPILALAFLLNQVAAVGVDNGLLSADGTNGAPLSLRHTPGITVEAGSALDWSKVTGAEETCALADVDDDNLSFIAAPGVRKILRQRAKFVDGSVPIWDGSEIAGHRAFVSTSVPVAHMFVGDFQNVAIAFWGPIEVLVNPYNTTGFKRGSIEIAVFVAMDVIVVHRGAFVMFESIS